MSADVRAMLARAWLGDGRAEHASIASFSRLSLHLMRLGAPPELLEACHDAGLDEIRHAQACFTLASAYGGEPVGPSSTVNTDYDEISTAPEQIVSDLVRIGCVGQSVAAVEAAVAAEAANDGAVRSVWLHIAEEEQEHSLFSWRCLRWILSGHGDVARDVATVAFAHALSTPRAIAETGDLREHGRLATSERRAIYRATCRDVLRPCATALGLVVAPEQRSVFS